MGFSLGNVDEKEGGQNFKAGFCQPREKGKGLDEGEKRSKGSRKNSWQQGTLSST